MEADVLALAAMTNRQLGDELDARYCAVERRVLNTYGREATIQDLHLAYSHDGPLKRAQAEHRRRGDAGSSVES